MVTASIESAETFQYFEKMYAFRDLYVVVGLLITYQISFFLKTCGSILQFREIGLGAHTPCLIFRRDSPFIARKCLM